LQSGEFHPAKTVQYFSFLKEIGVASYKLPDQVEIIEKWPLTSVGKVDKKVLVQIAQEKRGDYRDGIQ
jgi:non-ribosomal peptide synthetase component E (peptide arylation enzyme)